MKIKISAVAIILIILVSTLAVSANVKDNDNVENTFTSDDDVVEIRVAIYTDEKETDPEFYGLYSRTCYFVRALKEYSWVVGDTTYRFVPKLLSTKSLLRGELNIDNYDVLLYPPDTADEKMFFTSFSRLPRNKILRRNIVNFVKDGGGYFGTCAGAEITGGVENKPETFSEKLVKNSCIGISAVNVQIDTGIPILCQIAGFGPAGVGVTCSYLWYSGGNQTNYSINYHTGVCLDVPIFHGHPIFEDCVEDTVRVRWIGGPPYVIPENPDREVTIIARFPAEEISDNESTQIHYWKYKGGVRGLISAILGRGKIHYYEFIGIIMKAFCFASDWECTDQVVETNMANQPFMTAEIYPNENKARIVRCTGHPEHNVWWGGHIEEMEDTENNNIYEALYQWKNVIPEEETVEDEFTYTHWTIRRSIAWASRKVPDNNLPPVYGPSQVSDIYPYNHSSEFTVIGNAETADGIVSLDLYYRHSTDNETWSDWMLYATDDGVSDGWNWEFNAPKVPAYYQFYSIRNVEYEGYVETETTPPGPDAIAYVI